MLIHNWFETIVDSCGSKIAVSMGNVHISYTDLDKRANQLSHFLIANGVKAGDIVGVSLRRSPDLIAGVLAILKGGAAYLPLDPEYPSDRLAFMKDHSNANIILSDALIASAKVESYSSARPMVSSETINLAYVIYTSGSTGNPKGVCLGHRALVNLIEWQNQQTRNLSDLVTLQFTPLSFDVHFQEIFSTLTSGGELVLISEELRLNPVELIKTIDVKKIGRIFLPYVALNQLAETAVKLKIYPSNLKQVTTAGEQLKITPAIREFFMSLNGSFLYNHYGPSETHVVTSQTLSGNPETWPLLPAIGKAIDHCGVHLLNEHLVPVQKGSEGDLYISGICLADGYLNDKTMTSDRFIHSPTLGRIYKTGDLAIENENGSFHFLGRKDGQIKIRGHRVEIGEIEAQLLKLEKIKEVAVKAIELEFEKSLVCYYVSDLAPSTIRTALRSKLPEYMMPSHFIKMSSLPLTPSGKVDYKSLLTPSQERPELIDEYVSPENETQRLLVNLWKKHLFLNQVGILDNFFDLGGNSLLAIRMMIEASSELNRNLSVVDFFQAPTIKKLSSKFDGETLVEENKDESLKGNSSEIAVIGVAGCFPGAKSVDEFWSNLLAGKVTTNLFDPAEVNPLVPSDISNDPNYVFVQGEFPDQKSFDYKFFGMTPREAELMDPQQRKFLELAVEAMENAGHFTETSKEVVGVFAGMGNSKYSRLVDQYPEKVSQAGEFNVMLGLEKDYIATRISHKLNLTGPSLSLHTGCSTSLVAIIEAVKSLRAGDCSVALAGGISITGAPQLGHLSQEGGILTRDGFCRPFDDSASGTIFSEGAGIVVLKRLDAAIVDGDQILAVIKGVGINNDGSDKMSFTAPSSKGQADAITRSHRDAQIDPRSISYIEAHGTATPVGDPIEFQALKNIFEAQTKDKNFCYLSSVKANVGHLTAAAGVAGFIKALMVVNKGIVPPTANYLSPNKLLNLTESPFVIPTGLIKLPEMKGPRRAGVSSFGVGGTNAHVIIEQYVPEKAPVNKAILPTLFKLSAKSYDQVLEMEKNLKTMLTETDPSEWRKIAYTLEAGRKEYAHRKFIVIGSSEDVSKPVSSKRYSQLHAKKSLHMMFPGQGSQYICMGQNLFETSMIFRSEFEKCSEILEKINGYNIKSLLFNSENSDLINNTYYTQPAIFAIEYSLGKMMLDMGFKASGFVGHSIGEYVAATLAGIFSLEDGLKVISKRAELMKSLPSGMMLSVASSLELVQTHLQNFKLDIAAVNGMSSIVVSGSDLEVQNYKKFLDTQNVAAIVLKTSHAFHSHMMLPLVSEFEKYLETIPKNTPRISMLSTVSLKRDSSELLTSKYWAEHIVRTVYFTPAIDQLLSEEEVVLLEIGPGCVLSNLTRKQALATGKKDTKIISLLTDKSSIENSSVLDALGDLWLAGHKVSDARFLFKKEEQQKTSAPTYVFEKNTVWLDSTLPLKKLITKQVDMEIPVSTQNNDTFVRTLIELFEKSSGIDVKEYGNDASFLEMGMDSLFLTQISLQLKKELKINVTFRQLLEEYSSINLLAEAFGEKVEVQIPVEVKKPTALAQVEIQQLSQTPVAEVLHSGSALEQIIQSQIELMNKQLELLKNGPRAVPAPSPVKAVEKPIRLPKTLPSVRGADIKSAKDSFGAAAKINIEKNSKFTEKQKEKIDLFFSQYTKKTASSKNFTANHRKTHADPRVVTGFKPENKEIIYPIVVKKSEAQYLWDLDDNKYIDMTCGFGSNFFGNGNKHIKALVTKQLEEGIELGPQHPLVGEVSQLICDLTGNDRAAFCNTGSEAVLGAMRLARTVTGREKIVVFSGSYHGINDEVIIRSARDKSYPAAPGINGNAVSNMIVLEYGTDETLNIIRNMASDLAAVMVEPVQSRRCNFHPKEFLKEVRKITSASQTCLIFDEIITGFRIHPAGAQGHFGIRADLCTYGKIVGGGMPIGVISGKSEYMDALDGGHWEFGDDSTPTVGVTYFAGTFVRHPLALAAAKGALEILRDGGVSMLNDLNAKAQKFADEINAFCKTANIPFEMHNFGSLMKPKWTSDILGGELVFAILRYNGVHVYDGFPWFINLAHTDSDIKTVLETIKNSFLSLQKMGLLPNSNVPTKTSLVFNQNNPPVPHAKLGRTEQGHPAWFIENPNQAGEFLLIED